MNVVGLSKQIFVKHGPTEETACGNGKRFIPKIWTSFAKSQTSDEYSDILIEYRELEKFINSTQNIFRE